MPRPKKIMQIKDDDSDSVDSNGNLRDLISYSEEEEERPKLSKKRYWTRSQKGNAKKRKTGKDGEDGEDGKDGEDGEDGEDEDSEYFPEEEEDDGEVKDLPQLINLIFGSAQNEDYLKPKRHIMKDETPAVNKFFELLTTKVNESTIDDQIDMFKVLSDEKQAKVISALQTRNNEQNSNNPNENLMFRIMMMDLPSDVQKIVINKYQNLQMLDPSTTEYYKNRAWLEKVANLPLGVYNKFPVALADGSHECTKFMDRARRCLNEAVYGQEEAKLNILQYIAAKISNPHKKGASLLLVGKPGVGKTSLIKNGIAKAFDWPFQFISLGGEIDVTAYTGHQVVYEGSHCGKIANSLISAKSMSMILMFDEVDKVSATAKGEEVQHLLIHMTDPVQNETFEDKYFAGIPLDLGSVMYIFSANNINNIDKILLDRMNVVFLDGYNSKEKLVIATDYLLPEAIKDVALEGQVEIGKEVLQYIIENYAKEEAGIRELKRCLEQICQKINMLRMSNSKDLPFYVKDFTLPFAMKKEHVELFLKKKEPTDRPPMGMYV